MRHIAPRAFGGTWELLDATMRNDSDERGAKLVTESAHLVDYSIEADVMLLRMGGDAGLLLRSSDEEQGVAAIAGTTPVFAPYTTRSCLDRRGMGRDNP
jgi:hypothetical protein